MPVEHSAGCVVFRRAQHDPEFLLLKATFKTTFWKPPKGLIEQKESLEDAAVREAREETGLEVRLVPGFKETIDFFYQKEGRTIKKFVTYLLAEAEPDAPVKISEEHEEYAWLPADEAVQRATHETDKKVLRKAVEFLKQKRLM